MHLKYRRIITTVILYFIVHILKLQLKNNRRIIIALFEKSELVFETKLEFEKVRCSLYKGTQK